MSIKLVALDMDGTLLNSRGELPADFMDWVRHHPDIRTIIASGRQYYRIIKDFVPVQDKLIYVAENGGLVYEKGKVIYSNKMQEKDIRRCLECLDGLEGVTTVVCGAESAYMKPDKDVYQNIAMYYARLQMVEDLYGAASHDTVVKISVFVAGEKAAQMMKYFTNLGGELLATISGKSWIDISYKTVDKGSGVAAIQDYYGIEKKDCMAFGDYLNDVGMFEVCEESYCMGNGHPELKQLAKYITDSNDENGVMKILYQL